MTKSGGKIKKIKGRIRNHRMGMTLLLSGVVFLILVVTMVGADWIVLFLAKQGVIDIQDTSEWSVFRIGVDMAIISVLFGTILAFTAGRLPLISVNKCINAINAVADGDFSTRLNFKGPIGQLPAVKEMTESFNRMSEELENTETLRMDFINNFSHEFKTPIASISGFAKLLIADKNLSEEQKEEYLRIISEESQRLTTMATNVLALTRVENQTILSDVSTYNLSEQLRQCLLLFESRWEEQELEIVPEFGEIDVTGSEELLKQVWINLLDNAIKFTPKGGTIIVEVEDGPQDVTVRVKNSGSTLPEDTDILFSKFYQADRSHATAGNGIGLAIVKRVTMLHKGEVKAYMDGDFAVFQVRIPRPAPAVKKV